MSSCNVAFIQGDVLSQLFVLNVLVVWFYLTFSKEKFPPTKSRCRLLLFPYSVFVWRENLYPEPEI